MAKKGILLLALVCAMLAHPVSAEPYLAVAQGLQCSACHSHPSGGGMRNEYGNAFAQTQMPVQRLGDPDAPLWTGNLVGPLDVGGNFRTEYRYIDTPNNPSSSAFEVSRGTVYAQANIIPERLLIYVDQRVAPGSSLNREAYVRVNSADQTWHLAGGQFFLPYGLRLQDDSSFVRLASGANFTLPDRGVQVGYEKDAISAQLAVTNGSGGGPEVDSGKQSTGTFQFVQSSWRAGVSASYNNADLGDRTMYALFGGLRTGPIAWLAEVDAITDELPAGGERDSTASLFEANWLFRRGHNIKATYDFLDPDTDVDDDEQSRASLLWEYTPMQFLQTRLGARLYDDDADIDRQNRDEFFVELHGFF